jgi:hypothetical protein
LLLSNSSCTATTRGVKSCALPDAFASSCWGMPYDAVTFHANCVDAADAAAPTVGLYKLNPVDP